MRNLFGKRICLILTCVFVLSFTACSSGENFQEVKNLEKRKLTMEVHSVKNEESFQIQEKTNYVVHAVEKEIEPVDTFEIGEIPEFQGEIYVPIHENIPYFTEEELRSAKESFETYASLDSYGRCGVCVASIGRDIMPTEKRGEIGKVKPTGWKQNKYSGVIEDNFLYNRCHLIGYQLTGENANTKNLITGTRYFNTEGMLPFENMVADFVKEYDCHVLYRVTPIFDGNNMLADGVLMEAQSVEDDGRGIQFCVFVYNVQPGIEINYETGENELGEEVVIKKPTQEKKEEPAKEEFIEPDSTPELESVLVMGEESSYAVNQRNGKIHIVGACPATGSGDGAMNRPVYFSSYEEAEAYSIQIAPDQKKRKCGNCW